MNGKAALLAAMIGIAAVSSADLPQLVPVEKNIPEQFKSKLIEQADLELKDGLTTYRFSGGTMLVVSREMLAKALTLGAAYETTGDSKYSQSLKKQLLAACQFPNWNPTHFLDTAEMMTAVALGGSLIRNDLSPSEQASIQKALIEKGIQPALDAYQRGEDWTKRSNNWNQVCNSGLGLASLAVINSDSIVAGEGLKVADESLEKVAAFYGPDGASPEGLAYWNYGMDFMALYSSALKQFRRPSVFDSEVYSKARLVPMMLTGPSGGTFDYGDSNVSLAPSIANLELNRVYEPNQSLSWTQTDLMRATRPGVRWRENYRLMGFAALNWKLAPDLPKPPMSGVLRGASEVGVLRSDWLDPQALWLATRSGKNGEPHGHLDLGSFVLEMGGVRWVEDLGDDKYALDGYFNAGANGKRWSYFRTSTMGHSTLIFGQRNQLVTGSAKLQMIAQDALRMDGSAANSGVKKWTRNFKMISSNSIEVTDSVESAKSASVWQIVTRGEVQIENDSAILTRAGKRLRMSVVSGPTSKFVAKPAPQWTPAEDANTGVTLVQLALPPGNWNLSVRFELIPQ